MIKSALQSSLTNDVKYSSMSAGTVPSSEYLIQSVVVGATPLTSIAFDVSSFSSTYRHVFAVVSARTSRAASITGLRMRFNSSTGSNYSGIHYMQNSGSSVYSGYYLDSTSGPFTFDIPGTPYTSNVFVTGTAEILDLFSSGKNTTVKSTWGLPTSQVRILSSVWLSQSPVTQIVFEQADSSSFIEGSRFSLYGVI